MNESSEHFTEAQVRAVASELLSQERYNPAWCHPGDASFVRHNGLYERRARLILQAASAAKHAPREARS